MPISSSNPILQNTTLEHLKDTYIYVAKADLGGEGSKFGYRI